MVEFHNFGQTLLNSDFFLLVCLLGPEVVTWYNTSACFIKSFQVVSNTYFFKVFSRIWFIMKPVPPYWRLWETIRGKKSCCLWCFWFVQVSWKLVVECFSCFERKIDKKWWSYIVGMTVFVGAHSRDWPKSVILMLRDLCGWFFGSGGTLDLQRGCSVDGNKFTQTWYCLTNNLSDVHKLCPKNHKYKINRPWRKKEAAV